MKHLVPTLCLVIICLRAGAQYVFHPVPCPEKGLDEKPPVLYPKIREGDVTWSKRVWRTIDLREKINQPLYYPLEPSQCRMSLFDAIRSGLKTGDITAYGRPALDDEFSFPMTIGEVGQILERKDTVWVDQLSGEGTLPETVTVPLSSAEVMRYWIKEDWFFDKQRGVMEVRIIGICPLIEKIDKTTGEFRGYQPLFWLYYDECRAIFAKKPVLYHQSNTGQMPSIDDVFQKRIFSSFIHKESNVYDRYILDYAQGMDALLESDRVQQGLFFLEHDFWHF